MKKFILAAAIVGLCATAAQSADLPRAYTKAPPVAPVSNWTGWYAGVNVGYGFNDPTASFAANDPGAAVAFALGIPPVSYDVKGALGGVQIGYNWQVSPTWLLGLEADFQGSDIKGSGTTLFVNANPFGVTAQQNVEWFGTVRARAGWLATDKVLVFATGGLAYGSVKDSTSVYNTTGLGIFNVTAGFSVDCTGGAFAPCLAGNRTRIQAGYTVGGGFEYAAWQNVSFKIEYLYVNLGSSNISTVATMPVVGTTPGSFNTHFSDLDFNVVRAGVNVRF